MSGPSDVWWVWPLLRKSKLCPFHISLLTLIPLYICSFYSFKQSSKLLKKMLELVKWYCTILGICISMFLIFLRAPTGVGRPGIQRDTLLWSLQALPFTPYFPLFFSLPSYFLFYFFFFLLFLLCLLVLHLFLYLCWSGLSWLAWKECEHTFLKRGCNHFQTRRFDSEFELCKRLQWCHIEICLRWQIRGVHEGII